MHIVNEKIVRPTSQGVFLFSQLSGQTNSWAQRVAWGRQLAGAMQRKAALIAMLLAGALPLAGSAGGGTVRPRKVPKSGRDIPSCGALAEGAGAGPGAQPGLSPIMALDVEAARRWDDKADSVLAWGAPARVVLPLSDRERAASPAG